MLARRGAARRGAARRGAARRGAARRGAARRGAGEGGIPPEEGQRSRDKDQCQVAPPGG